MEGPFSRENFENLVQNAAFWYILKVKDTACWWHVILIISNKGFEVQYRFSEGVCHFVAVGTTHKLRIISCF